MDLCVFLSLIYFISPLPFIKADMGIAALHMCLYVNNLKHQHCLFQLERRHFLPLKKKSSCLAPFSRMWTLTTPSIPPLWAASISEPLESGPDPFAKHFSNWTQVFQQRIKVLSSLLGCQALGLRSALTYSQDESNLVSEMIFSPTDRLLMEHNIDLMLPKQATEHLLSACYVQNTEDQRDTTDPFCPESQKEWVSVPLSQKMFIFIWCF